MTAPPIVRAMAGWGPPPSLQGWFLSFYLALAPVYLIPGIELRELWWVKAGLLMAAFALVFIPALARRELRLPGGILGIWGFAALAAVSIPGMAQAADLRDALFYLIDIGLGALFLWCFCHLARRGDDLAPVFLRALGVMGLLAGIAIVRTWVNAPDWGSPFYRLWNTEINAGFGHSKSTWSISLALCLPAAALAADRFRRWRWPWLPWAVFAGLIVLGGMIFGAQLFAGGRNGILMSGVAVALLLAAPGLRLLGAGLLVTGMAMGGWCVSDGPCAEHMNLRQAESAAASVRAWVSGEPLATPEPTRPAPTATPPPAPSATAPPTPSATAPPAPTATSLPAPTAASPPAPTATAPPAPTAASPPAPTATSPPAPTATSPPAPTATSPPTPTATPPPSPTATSPPSPTARAGDGRPVTAIPGGAGAPTVVLIPTATPIPTPTPRYAAAGRRATTRRAAVTPTPGPPPTPTPVYVPSVSVNRLFTERFSGYSAGVDRILERPLRGHGLRQVWVEGSLDRTVEIHNLWIKLAVYSGVLPPLVFLGIVMALLLASWRAIVGERAGSANRRLAMAMGIILVLGGIATLFEPNALLGAFHYTALWWAAAGVALGLYLRRRDGGDVGDAGDASGGSGDDGLGCG